MIVDDELVRKHLGRARFEVEEISDRTSTPGVATGLAVTGAGGDVLFVEATALDGEPGLQLTGQLGDVMKESAQIALSYVGAHADALGVASDALARPALPRARARGRGARRTGRRPASP